MQKITITRSAQRELFTTLYNENNSQLIRYAQRKVSDPELGKDLVQEAFLKTWSYASQGGEIENMKGFLYRILNNSIVDWYRKQKQKALSLDGLLANGYELGRDDTARLVDILDGESAFGLMRKLPDTYQTILNLKYRHHRSIEEIAELCGKSRNSVSVCLHRGLAKLRVAYESGIPSTSPQALTAHHS